MKLFKCSQTSVDGYDTYSDFVVAAKTEDEARNMHPCDSWNHWSNDPGHFWKKDNGTWCKTPAEVTVEYLGNAKPGTKAGFICLSFHAG